MHIIPWVQMISKFFFVHGDTGKTVPDSKNWSLVVLFAILGVAAIVRIYALGVPIFLHDETLVLDTALRSFDYIHNRSLQADAHPPFYYYLYKILELKLRSEFSLRLLSVLSGLASVSLLYQLCGKYVSRQVAYIASSLLAVGLVHVAISRVVRPHALMAMLGLACTYRLLRFMEEPSRRNLFFLWIPNFMVSLWHFNGVLVIGSQLAVLLAMGIVGRIPRRMALLGLVINGSCLLVPLYFLVVRLGQFPGVDIGHGTTMLWTFQRTVHNIVEIVTLPFGDWTNVVAVIAVIIGYATLLKHNTTLAAVLGIITLAPLFTLIAMRYGIIYQSQHIIFIVPYLFIFFAIGLLQTKIKADLFVFCILLFGSYGLFAHKHTVLYEMNSEFINNNMRQKQIHRQLPPRLGTTDIVGFYPGSRVDTVNWEYLKAGTGDLRRFTITPHDAFVNFYLVKVLNYPPADGDRMFGIDKAGFKSLTTGWLEDHLQVTGYRIDRMPTFIFDTLPMEATITADPEVFFRRVHNARDLMTTFSPLGNTVSPAAYERPGSFSFRFDNAQAQFISDIEIQTEFENTWKANSFVLTYSFDENPPEQGISLNNALHQGTTVLQLGRTKAFKTLDIAVSMRCSSSMPSFYNNPDTLAFRRLQVSMRNDSPSFSSTLPVAIVGLDKREGTNAQHYHWGLGPETIVRFTTDEAQHLQLNVDARSPIPGQSLTFALDGQEQPLTSLLLGPDYEEHSLVFRVPAGDHTLHVRYGLWNHGDHGNDKETFEPTDPRLLAASFREFRLLSADAHSADVPSSIQGQ
jgi:hypothetical protein